MTNKTSVGIIEKAKNEITSLILRPEPRSLRRRSIKSFPIFRVTNQQSVTKIMMLMLRIPKKKIELTKGSVLERLLRRNSATDKLKKRTSSPKIASSSRLRLRRSRGSRGGRLAEVELICSKPNVKLLEMRGVWHFASVE